MPPLLFTHRCVIIFYFRSRAHIHASCDISLGALEYRWMAAMRRCQRIDDTSSRSSPGLGGAVPEGLRGAGAGRKTVGLRAEALMDKFRKANPVSERKGVTYEEVPWCLGQPNVLRSWRGAPWRDVEAAAGVYWKHTYLPAFFTNVFYVCSVL